MAWDSFTVPEGLQLNETFQTDFIGLLNNTEMTQAAKAQALLDLHAKVGAESTKAIETQWNSMQQTWQDEIRADPVIGGDKLPEALGQISQLVDRYGTPELRTVFDMTGAGNNPLMIRFLHTIAKQLNEPGAVVGQAGGGAVSLAEQMYPSMKK